MESEKRGYIDTHRLSELWLHTGTACNLQCPDCFEGSAPGDRRLDALRLEDVIPFVDEAVKLGVEKFSFTGGEPFVNKDIDRILDFALDFRPCLVLTNGTAPLQKRFEALRPLLDKPCELSFRVSLDYPDSKRHDARRGEGMFELALDTLARLHRAGFHVSVARRREEEDPAVGQAYREVFESAGLSPDTDVIAFPELKVSDTPEITEECMRTHHTPESCAKFMCAFSRMVVKQKGRMRVYACTLVDDSPYYDLGSSLAESAKTRVRLKHSRCFACFAGGVSCSEMN